MNRFTQHRTSMPPMYVCVQWGCLALRPSSPPLGEDIMPTEMDVVEMFASWKRLGRSGIKKKARKRSSAGNSLCRFAIKTTSPKPSARLNFAGQNLLFRSACDNIIEVCISQTCNERRRSDHQTLGRHFREARPQRSEVTLGCAQVDEMRIS